MFAKYLATATMLAFAPVSIAHAEGDAKPATIAELPSGKYTLDPTHASLTWKVSHMGMSYYTARFTKLDATINLDSKDATKSTLIATVDPKSLETDYPTPEKEDFDAKLTGTGWLDAAKFPEIKFVSSKIEKTSDNTGKIYGDLTFLGITKPLVLNAKFNGGMKEHPFTKAAALGVSATGVLKRSDWGFSAGSPYIGDEVQLLIETEFFQAK